MAVHWLNLLGNLMTNRVGAMCLALPLAAIAVALIDDRYRLMRQIRREASIEALEALFALTDPREVRRR